MTCSGIIDGLRTCELLALLSERELEKLVASLGTLCQIKTHEAGDNIFAQGEHITSLYIIADGQVLLQRSVNLGDRIAVRPIALLGKGRAMGWSALLYGPHYASATALCQKPTQIIAVDGTSLRSILEENQSIGFKVMERLACMLGDRLRAAYSALETHI